MMLKSLTKWISRTQNILFLFAVTAAAAGGGHFTRLTLDELSSVFAIGCNLEVIWPNRAAVSEPRMARVRSSQGAAKSRRAVPTTASYGPRVYENDSRSGRQRSIASHRDTFSPNNDVLDTEYRFPRNGRKHKQVRPQRALRQSL